MRESIRFGVIVGLAIGIAFVVGYTCVSAVMIVGFGGGLDDVFGQALWLLREGIPSPSQPASWPWRVVGRS